MKKTIAAVLLLSICLLAACGEAPVGPAPEPTPTPTPEATPTPPPQSIAPPELSEPSGVFTDWSKLTEYVAPEEKYTRLSPEPLTELHAGDYGLLLPFEGERKFEINNSWAAGSRYGLITAEGCIVLDAVCDSIRQGDYWGNSGLPEYLPVYILERVEHDPDDPRANEYNEGWFSTYAVCAMDGSWCTDFVYDGVYVMPDGVACVIDSEKNLVECFDVEGNFVFSTADWAIREQLAEWSVYNISQISGDGWVNVSLRNGDEWDHGYINAKGELLETEHGSRFERANVFSEGLAAVRVNDKWGYIDVSGDWVIEPSYPYDYELSPFRNGRALVSSNRRSFLIDPQGKVLASVEKGLWAVNYGEYGIYCDYDDGSYYDENLQPILMDGARATNYSSGGIMFERADGVLLRRMDGKTLFFPGAGYADYAEGYFICLEDGRRKLYDYDGNFLFDIGGESEWSYVRRDAITGEPYVFADRNGSYNVYSIEGEKLLSGSTSMTPVNGLFRCEDSTTVGYKNTQNEWVFRIRLDSGD